MKKYIINIGFLGAALITVGFSVRTQRTSDSIGHERAFSLRLLQSRLQTCMTKQNCSEILLNFAGLTKLNGYVINDQINDIILLGIVDSTASPLLTEDFVVALRNAWGKYSTINGISQNYIDPGCSIDPNLDAIAELSELTKEILTAKTITEVEKGIEKWHAICKKDQNVRILGIPFNTHFAKVMVDADYYMKRLVDGSAELGISSFTSLIDIMLARIKEDIIHNRPISVQINPANRFEFYPGENKFIETEEGTIVIEKCPVILLTEIEYLTKSGKIKGSGQVDPLAQNFAKSFSSHYNQIASKEPMYQELEGLFRFVAIAKIIKNKRVKIDLNYLLDEFPLSQTEVKPVLPGLSHIEKFEHHLERDNGYQIAKLWLPSCGGVNIKIDIKPENFEKKPAEQLDELRDIVLAKRPSPDTLFWDF